MLWIMMMAGRRSVTGDDDGGAEYLTLLLAALPWAVSRLS